MVAAVARGKIVIIHTDKSHWFANNRSKFCRTKGGGRSGRHDVYKTCRLPVSTFPAPNEVILRLISTFVNRIGKLMRSKDNDLFMVISLIVAIFLLLAWVEEMTFWFMLCEMLRGNFRKTTRCVELLRIKSICVACNLLRSSMNLCYQGFTVGNRLNYDLYRKVLAVSIPYIFKVAQKLFGLK